MVTEDQANAAGTFVARRRPVFVRQGQVEPRRPDGEVDCDGRDARGFGALLVYAQQGLGYQLDDYAAFAGLFGVTATVGSVLSAGMRGSVHLYLGRA